ncbi:CWF19-like protein 2 [Sesamum alatum]|uniref:CWF19-like protein 2 n=1 Tax=Sesamum alatum TaxID=300844 RepID=A0AAE1Y8Z4_9LAMI|nr:CWF19-like protein 2 [Sesamum alatum]
MFIPHHRQPDHDSVFVNSNLDHFTKNVTSQKTPSVSDYTKLLDSLLYDLSKYCDLRKETMLSGLKFIPRDQIDKDKDETFSTSRNERKKSGHRKEKIGRKQKHSRYSSSDDEGLERIKTGSRKKKKWYDSEEDLSSSSEKSDSQSEEEHDRKKRRRRKGEKKRRADSSDNERKSRSKKRASSRRKNYSSEDESLSGSEREDTCGEGSQKDDSKGSQSQNSSSIVRKEMGLEWMLRPKDNTEKASNKSFHIEPEEAPAEEIKKDNPGELNPYLKNNGSGYPEDSDGVKTGDKQILSTAVIGDGGASWRLKALKRAQEQAAREGRKLQEVVEERWGAMGHFAASVASHSVAPTHAHLQAIKSRRKGLINEEKTNIDEENDRTKKDFDQRRMKDFHPRHPKMRVPKVDDSLSWGKRGSKKLSTEDTALVSAALSSLNKFSDDGSFMDAFMNEKEDNSGDPSNSLKFDARAGPKSDGIVHGETKDDAGTVKPDMSANQLAAKALQLRMKGKHEEAEKLLKEVENIKEKQNISSESSKRRVDGTTSRIIMQDVSARQKKKEDDADLHLAQKIMHNHRYNVSNQADEEYDYDDGPRRKTRKKGGAGNHNASEITHSANRFLTQQDRCQFCFENPNRPKHLVIAIANFTYLSLPHQQPVVPGHCAILTLQHESSTRTVDDNVWSEIRNFKKCLIMMFAKQEKDVLFLETVMGLAQQRRHCLVECIPLPRDVAKQAPVYFKKAIDEAEDEWSQHNAKKLIDTSEKGLRSSIPKNFPYFHVEFGLDKGFVHVIDDEKEFKSSFGLNVVRGMLRLPAEDMHRRRRNEPVDIQKQAVASFARDWEPFDWTKQLD